MEVPRYTGMCENLTSRDRGDGVREYLCGDTSLARLIRTGGSTVLSIDVLAPWNMPVDSMLRVGEVQLLYRREVIDGDVWEFVGYDDGSRRELISIRIFLSTDVDEARVKELIIKASRAYWR